MAKTKTYEMRDEKNEKIMELSIIDDDNAELTMLNGGTKVANFSYRKSAKTEYGFGSIWVFLADLLLRKKGQ